MRNVIAGLGLAALAWSPLSAAEPDSPLFDPESPLAGAPERLVSSGVSFLIPGGYIHDRTRRWGTKDGIDLWALWPGLVPHHAGNAAAFDAPGGGAKLDISIRFFRDPELRSVYLWRAAHPGYARSGQAIPDDFSQRLWNGERYGLKAGLIDFKKVTLWLSAHRSQPITQLDDFEKGRWDDLFYREDENEWVQTVIECATQEISDPPDEKITGKSIIRVPHCRHQFIINEINASVLISYRRAYFPKWRQIERDIAFILSKFHNEATHEGD